MRDVGLLNGQGICIMLRLIRDYRYPHFFVSLGQPPNSSMKTSFWVLLLLVALQLGQCSASSEEGEEGEPEDAVLFPAFALTIGIIAFWLITR